MTKQEEKAYINGLSDNDDLDWESLSDAYLAVFGHRPAESESAFVVYSELCAALDITEYR